ncbi:hypothetical protein Glove_209g120 [Diversispora epigaea]|uniref:Uncharacterized protein n=1 Tax=Diversispora epigaea TaxID=1348612 RepID=A0A397IRS0_9GLOM|nr:hypothetical protein Glove_209g120 [Diversispora epigaea]
MDPQVINKIIQALEIIHSPFASKNDRNEAQKYCNMIKDECSLIYGPYLASRNNNLNSDIVRHFGLLMIEDGIRFHWNDYSKEERERIKQSVISLIQEESDNNLILTEKLYIKEKLAKLFADIAKREWPNNWPGMNLLLKNLYDSGPTTQELSLIIFRYLAEEMELRDSLTCIVASSSILQMKYPDNVKVTDSRRKDEITIMQGEQPNDEGWLIIWIRSLEQFVIGWEQFKNLETIEFTETTKIIYEKLAIATINTINAHMEWIFTETIVNANVITIISNCLLIDCHGIKMASIECLWIILTRNFQTPEERALILEPIYEQNVIDLLIAVYNKITQLQLQQLQQQLEENEYNFLKKFVDVIIEIGEKHICYKNNTIIPKRFPAYLELIYEISKHPSNTIAFNVMKFWQTALRHLTISKGINEQETLPIMLMELFTERLKTLFQPKDIENKITYYINIDFDSSNDYRIFIQVFRVKFIDIIKLITQMRPTQSFYWMVERIQRTLIVSPNITDLDEEGVCKVDSLFYISFEAEMTLMDSIVIGIEKLIKQNDNNPIKTQKNQIINDLKSLLQMILNIDYSDPVMTHRYLASLVSFVDLLTIDSLLLFPLLQKIFIYVVYLPLNYNESSHVPIPIQRLRSGAIGTLTKFGFTIPNVLMNIYSDISNYINDLTIDKKNNLSGKEKSSLQEFLISIIYNSSLPLEQKQLLFDPIVQPTINNWNLPRYTSFITSFTQFSESSGIYFLSKVVNDMKEKCIYNGVMEFEPGLHKDVECYRSRRNKVIWLENSILIWLRRTTDNVTKGPNSINIGAELWKEYFPTILSTTLVLIRFLHQLWNIKAWKDIPVELQEILMLSHEEKASIIGHSEKSPLTDSYTKQYTIAGMMNQIRKWLSALRIDCYYVLGRLAVLGQSFYSIHNVHESLTQALFENAESLNNIHWKMLLNILFFNLF